MMNAIYYGYIIKGSNSQMKTLPWYYAFIWFEWEATNIQHREVQQRKKKKKKNCEALKENPWGKINFPYMVGKCF